MIHVKLPEEVAKAPHRLAFYLAMEELLARRFSGEYFFMWQVEPTVIFGRNQIIDAEVNLDYCRREGIDTCRRKSGGGCVFADMNNIMFSHITTCTSVAVTFTDFTTRVANMLCALGIDAHTTGRNDILIGDRKVSGYAFYHIPLTGSTGALSRAIVHGTMLHDVDPERMTAALTPSAEKLKAKGVESVRSHVTTIREHSDISLEEFKVRAAQLLCSEEMTLTSDDVAEIERIAAPYYTPQWTYGHRYAAPAAPATAQSSQPIHRHRIEGVGEFVVDMTTEAPSGIIDNCFGAANPTADDSAATIASLDLKGDFFLLADIDSTLLAPLKGVRLTRTALNAALANIDVGQTVAGMTNENLVDLLLAETSNS
jgi:lipoic acid synthetase/lipoate-protein ligase A